MNIDTYSEEVRPWLRQFEALGNGSEQRAQALKAFATAGFPSTKHEEWKYTSVRSIAGKEWAPAFQAASQQPDLNSIQALLPAGVDVHLVVLVDGKFASEYSKIQPEAGLSIRSLAAAFKDSSAVLSFTEANESAFVALNTAFAQDGVEITVARGKEIQKPVCIVYASTQPGEASTQVRNVVHVGEGASLHVHEAWLQTPAANFHNQVTEIHVGRDARVYHDQVQNAPAAQQIGFTQVVQGSSSRYHSFVLSTEGSLVRNNLHVRHAGQHCETHLLGLYLLDENDHVDNHTLIDHAEPNCFSNELYKGVLGGKSTAVFNGKVMVRKDAQKTNAFQSNKTVLLSQGARINTKPQLEIFADDVKCSHGATTGRLDEQALFYLRSRGLSEKAAMALLTYAFAAEVLEKIEHAHIRAHLKTIVEAKLQALATEK